jgi:hypothetical protein
MEERAYRFVQLVNSVPRFQFSYPPPRPLDELVAAQVNLAFENIPRPIPYSVSDKFPIPLLRYTPVFAKLVKEPVRESCAKT